MPYFEAGVSHYFDSIKIATAELLERFNTEVEKLRIEDDDETIKIMINILLN